MGFVRYALLFALALSGCGRCGAPVGTNADAAPPATRWAARASASASSDTVRYDCAGVEPPGGEGCGGRKAEDDLIDLSERLPEVAAEHAAPDASYWTKAEAALAPAETVDPASLTTEERVLVQNAALHLALVSATLAPKLARRAKALVKKLAFRERPAAEPAGLEAWLGPSSEWQERTSPMKPLFHEQIFHDTRVLRLVHTKTLRANFSQLVAIDESGTPFVTGVVGSIEIRRGFGRDAPACVVLASPARVRCRKLGGLAAAPNASRFPQSHFLGHDDDFSVRCNGCHASEDTVMGFTLSNLAPEEVASVLAARREAALRALTTAYASIP
jgi:hypothetical protein